MKIFVSDIEKSCDDMDWEGKYLWDALKDQECVFFEKTVQDYTGDLAGYKVLVIFIHSQIDKDILDKMPDLKMIATRSTGYDHIDLMECKNRGIIVTNVPSYGENTVAEYAFALLMTLARRMYEAYDRTKNSNYNLKGLMGFDLMGKTLGVIGGGKIGQHAIKIGLGYGMKVKVFDVFKNLELAKEMGFEYVELDELYALSDIITIHVPLIPPTKHMINREAFVKMKDGVILINTARGGIVDTTALVEALESGKLGGAGLDVLEGEEWLADELDLVDEETDVEKMRQALVNHILMDDPRIVITFHNAFNTREGRSRILDMTIENIKSWQAGKIINEVKVKEN